jgi:hypothetical protein
MCYRFANEAYAKSIVNEGGFIITQSGAAGLELPCPWVLLI